MMLLMKVYEIATGYTSIPAKISAATELVVEELTRSMLKEKVDVKIIDIKDNNRQNTDLPIIEVEMPKKFYKTDVQLGILHKMKRVIYSIRLAKKIKNLLKEENQKVVLHFHNQYNLYFFLHLTSRKVRKKCLIAYTNHSGIWGLDWKSSKSTIKKKYFQEAYCMKKADLVFVLNNKMYENIINHLKIDKDKLIKIANGVNEKIYKPLLKTEIQEIKKEYNLENKKIILQVGSINENKGQLKSIQALESLLKEDKNYMFLYAGGIVQEDYYQKIENYVSAKNLTKQVKYLGMLPPGGDLCKLYNISEALIISSQYEGFSLVGIESLSCGVPVLLKKESSLYYGPGTIYYENNIIETIQKEIVENKNLKEKCRENVLQNYSWRMISQKYVSSFKEKLK